MDAFTRCEPARVTAHLDADVAARFDMHLDAAKCRVIETAMLPVADVKVCAEQALT